MKSARDWNTALSKNPSQEGLQQQQDFLSIQTATEAQAATFFSHIRDHELPAAINHAANHGHYTVGFYVPSWHLNTDAFFEFRSWLQENGFVCMSARLDPADREHPDQDVVLNIIPVS